MKVVLSACVIVAVAAVAAAAPAAAPSSQEQEAPVLRIHEDHPELYRGKRSHYGQPVPGVQYYSPCGGGAGPIPALAPSPYGHHAQIAAYHAPAHYAQYAHQGLQGYGYPQYRDADESELAFSDMEPLMSEHIPMSRFAYAPAGAGHYGVPSLGGVQTTGPAFGVFPNANTGGCGVPLLLSCSPSIVPGRIVSAHPAGSFGAQGHDSYRSDEQAHEQDSHLHDQQALSEPAQTSAKSNIHQ